MTIKDLMDKHGITIREVAAHLDVHEATVGHKLCGRRRWTIKEVDVLLPYFRERTGESPSLKDFIPPVE